MDRPADRSRDMYALVLVALGCLLVVMHFENAGMIVIGGGLGVFKGEQ